MLDKYKYRTKIMIKYLIKYFKDDGRYLDKYLELKTGKEDAYLHLSPYLLNLYTRDYVIKTDELLDDVMTFVKYSHNEYGVYNFIIANLLDEYEINIEDYFNYIEVFGDIDKALKDALCNLSCVKLDELFRKDPRYKDLEEKLFNSIVVYNNKDILNSIKKNRI